MERSLAVFETRALRYRRRRWGPIFVAAAVEAAAAARADGILVFVVRLGLEVETDVLQRMAGDPRQYFTKLSAGELAAV